MGEKSVFSVIASKSFKSSLFDIFRLELKDCLHISHKDRKHMFANRFLSFPYMLLSSHSCNDRRYSYLRRNICNRYIDSIKILFRNHRKHVVRLLRLYGEKAYLK